MENLDYLLWIAKQGGLRGVLKTTTLKMARDLSHSQQSVSRILLALEANGFVKRNATPKGVELMLADAGMNELAKLRSELDRLFSQQAKITLTGKLKSGLGEGRYYMSLRPYLQQFKKLLGYNPYPGTLNLQVVPVERSAFISALKRETVTGFVSKNRTFGNLNLYHVRIGNLQAAVIEPARTTHSTQIVEVISPIFLRKRLGVKDGDNITLEEEKQWRK